MPGSLERAQRLRRDPAHGPIGRVADLASGPAIRLDGELQYEALNLWDGKRTDAEIRDMLSAIYHPVPVEDVTQYLDAVASIGVIDRVSGRR